MSIFIIYNISIKICFNLLKRVLSFLFFFSGKKDCKECDLYEKTLVNIREDIVESMNAWVVKNVDSSLIKLYSPNDKPPVVVFFRHGIPLLFHGNFQLCIEDLFRSRTHIRIYMTYAKRFCIYALTAVMFLLFFIN